MSIDSLRPARLHAWLRDAPWLTRERAVAYLCILAIGNVVGLSLALCHAHGWLMPAEKHFSTEFMGFYAAGRLVDDGSAALVYAPGIPVKEYIASLNVAPAHMAMQRTLGGDPDLIYFTSFYPPVFWLICAPLARLPYYVAFVLWVAASLGFFLCALRAIVGSWQKLWPAAAYLAFFQNAGVGENSFLSAGLVGFGLLQLERRPVLAGVLFGSLCYKPHFVLPVGIVLLAGRHWKALASAAVTSVTICLLAGVAFGFQQWVDYVTIVVPHAQWMLRHDGFSYLIQVTPFSAMRILHAPIVIADLFQIAATLFAAAAVFIATRSGNADVRGAMLAASFPLMESVMLNYDLTICALAIPFLYRATSRTGFLPWEKLALGAMFVLPLVSHVFRFDLHVPLDTLLVAGFMIVLLLRIRAERQLVVAT